MWLTIYDNNKRLISVIQLNGWAVCFEVRKNGRIEKLKGGSRDVTCNSLIATQESEGNWLSIGTKNIRQADQ